MSREKHLAKTLSVWTGIILLICTIASQIIYRQMLPVVRAVEPDWQENGFVLPREALFTSPEGTCVYYIEERQNRSGPGYLIRAVLVTVQSENPADGTVIVRGIYDPGKQYAASADITPADGMEVKIAP